MPQHATPITQDDIDNYQRDGAVLLKGALPQCWVQRVSEGLEACYTNPGELSSRLAIASEPGEIRMDQMPSVANPALNEVVYQSPLAAIAGGLLQQSTVYHVLDQMFYKPAGTILPTAWHQDTPYLNIQGHDLCRLWIPCDASPKQVTIQVVRGSHLWNVEYRPVEPEDVEATEEDIGGGFSYKEARFNPMLPKVPDIAKHQSSFDLLSWDCEPGDVVAFNGNILHGSSHTIRNYPNKRRAFAVLWAAPDIKAIKRPGHRVPDMAVINGLDLETGVALKEGNGAYPAVSINT